MLQPDPTLNETAANVTTDSTQAVSARLSRTQRLLGGLIMTYGYQGLLMLSGFLLTPFYLGRIGQHDYGLWLVGTQLLNYLSLTDFGVVALLPLETAYATGRAGGAEKATDLPTIIGRTVHIVLCQLPLVAIIAAMMWFTIPAEWQHLRGPLAVVLVGFVLGFPLRLFPAILQGLQDLVFANGIQTCAWITTTAATVLMVLAGWNLYAIAVGWLLGQFLMPPVCIYRLWTRFPGVLPHRLPPLVWSAMRTHLGKGFWVSVGQVAQLLTTSTDMLIVGKVLGPLAVVPYAITGKLPGVLGNQPILLMHTAAPALCELKTGESRKRVFQALAALTQGMLTFSGLVFCIVVAMNHWFVDWWVASKHYGEQYAGFALTLAILVNMLIRHWTGTTAYTVFCFDHQRRISLTNFADGVVTAACSVVGCLVWGLIGAAIGSILGACLVSLPLNLRMIARDTDTTLRQLVSGMLGGWLWRFALLAGGAIVLSLRWTPRSIIEAIGGSVAIAFVYGAVMLQNVLRAPLGNYVRPLASSFRAKYAALQIRFSS